LRVMDLGLLPFVSSFLNVGGFTYSLWKFSSNIPDFL
jgi:hypothetical protein